MPGDNPTSHAWIFSFFSYEDCVHRPCWMNSYLRTIGGGNPSDMGWRGEKRGKRQNARIIPGKMNFLLCFRFWWTQELGRVICLLLICDLSPQNSDLSGATYRIIILPMRGSVEMAIQYVDDLLMGWKAPKMQSLMSKQRANKKKKDFGSRKSPKVKNHTKKHKRNNI